MTESQLSLPPEAAGDPGAVFSGCEQVMFLLFRAPCCLSHLEFPKHLRQKDWGSWRGRRKEEGGGEKGNDKDLDPAGE